MWARQWGNTEGVEGYPGIGWDGTNGDQPRFSSILYNFVHELGIWEKQVGGRGARWWVQEGSCS